MRAWEEKKLSLSPDPYSAYQEYTKNVEVLQICVHYESVGRKKVIIIT